MHTIERGTCEIDTYASGMLGRFGHDLRLSLERFRIRVDDDEVEVVCHTDTIRVEGAVVDGEVDRDELSASNRRDIRSNIREDVLMFERHDTATFEGTYTPTSDDAFEVEGELTLVGRSEPLSARVVRDSGRLRTEIEIVPSRWGVEPYTAMMGALKVEDRVRIRFDVPAVED